MTNKRSYNGYYFPQWFRFGFALPTVMLGVAICTSAICKSDHKSLNELVVEFGINSAMVSDFTKKVDEHTQTQNIIAGCFFAALGAASFFDKKARLQA